MKSAILLTLLFLSCTWFYPSETKYYIKDNQDRITIYHGINISNVSKETPDYLPWQTREDFQFLKTHGFNLARYLVFWQALEPVKGQYDTSYVRKTCERLQWLRELGIDVLVDIHQDLYTRRYLGDGFPDWTIPDTTVKFTPRQPWAMNYTEPAVIKAYTSFWNNLDLQSRYYKAVKFFFSQVPDSIKQSIVGVDLMNEPFPGLKIDFEQKALSMFYEMFEPYFPELKVPYLFYEPIILTSAGVPTGLKYRPRISAVFAPHYYDPFCHEGKPYVEKNRLLMKEALKIKAGEASKFKVPLFIGEFGISTSTENYQQYLRDFTNQMDMYSASWSYYSADTVTKESFGIHEPGYSKLSLLSRIYPQKINGVNPTYFMGDTTFDLSFTSNSNDLESVIFIPDSYRITRVFLNDSLIQVPVTDRSLRLKTPGNQKVHIQVDFKILNSF